MIKDLAKFLDFYVDKRSPSLITIVSTVFNKALGQGWVQVRSLAPVPELITGVWSVWNSTERKWVEAPDPRDLSMEAFDGLLEAWVLLLGQALQDDASFARLLVLPTALLAGIAIKLKIFGGGP